MDPDEDAPSADRPSGVILVFRIAAELGSVDEAGRRIHDLCVREPFNEQDAGDMELCAREALSNIIEHAYRGGAGNMIDIVARCSSSSIVLEFADAGASVASEVIETDPGALANDLTAGIDDLAERGRGVSILHALLDSIRYRSAAGRNVLTLTRRSDSLKRASFV